MNSSGNVMVQPEGSSTPYNAGGVFADQTPGVAQDEASNSFVVAIDAYGGAWIDEFTSSYSFIPWAYSGGGGPFKGKPAVAVAGDASVWVCLRDAYNPNSGSYWLVNWSTTAGFGQFLPLGGVFASDPVMAVRPDGLVYIAGLDTSGSAWGAVYTPGQAVDGRHPFTFTFLAGVFGNSASPAMAVGSDNAAYLIANDTSNVVWMGRLYGSAWSGWTSTTAVSGKTPSIAPGPSNLYAAVLNSGTLYTCSWVIGLNTCNTWTNRGGGTLQTISASVVGNDLLVAAVDQYGSLWWYHLNTLQNQWLGPFPFGTSFPMTASVTSPWAGAAGSVIPSMSTLIPAGSTGIAETFMFTTNTDSLGPTSSVKMLIENSGVYSSEGHVDLTQACLIQYLTGSNVLLLYGNDGVTPVNYPGSAPGAPVGSSPPQNGQCMLDTARSWVSQVPNTYELTFQLAVTFFPSWASTNSQKEIYFDILGQNGVELPWSNRGSWTVPLAVPGGPPVTAGSIAVTTDHYDVFRTGANVHETVLTPANVGALNLKGTIPLSACAWAQPLYVPNVRMTGGPHSGNNYDVLYVATADGLVSAFDTNPATGFQSLWTKQLLGGADSPGDSDIFDCTASVGDGQAGIVGTPVIDLATNVMYVDMNNSAGGQGIYALDITSGQLRTDIPPGTGVQPAVVQGTANNNTFISPNQLERGGLLLADYSVIVPYGSYADFAGPTHPYEGWLFNFDRGLALQDAWSYGNVNTPSTPNYGGASIWMSGGGPAFDGRQVYVATANNTDDGCFSACPPCGYSNSLLGVNPYGIGRHGLGQINQFLPAEASNWRKKDDDFGSIRTIVLPGTNYVVVGGKTADVYVVDRSQTPMSNICSSITNENCFIIYKDDIATNRADGDSMGRAYWNQRIYTWDPMDTLQWFPITGNADPTKTHRSSPQTVANFEGAPISVSSNFDANGLIWGICPSGDPHDWVPGDLIVYDATSLQQLKSFDLSGDRVTKFTAPLVVNGKVFVVTASRHVLVYGL